MANMTVKELMEHFLRLEKEKTRIDMASEIYAAEVVKEGDPEFPPGTILFGCKSMNDDEKHLLSIYPMKLGKLQ